jgi:hypothetical protein
MRATVTNVTTLQEFRGTAVRAHFDPRFAITLRIESVTPALTNFRPGSLVTFAIHSPPRLFGGETPNGQTLDFTLSREARGSTKGAFTLELQRGVGQTVQRTEASRVAQMPIPRHRRLAPVADLCVSRCRPAK